MQPLIPITLINATMLSPKVKHFTFAINATDPFDYIPGQFITLHLDYKTKRIKRSYSIANPPNGNNILEFAAGYSEGGAASELLFNLKPEETLMMSGPFGRLTLKETEPKRYILAATSTGITPYRAMIEELKKRLKANSSLQVVVILGVQKDNEILYAEEFGALCADFPTQVSFKMQLSRANQADLKPHQSIGYVQHTFESLALNPAHDVVYLCGNPAMIDESFRLLKEVGFGPQNIIREKYISSPSGA